ncbi:hypothetical protein BB987_12385 [Photorhabdus temperata]|nr:hypothetical protein BB987_12385 [Photorhabdus temperata]
MVERAMPVLFTTSDKRRILTLDVFMLSYLSLVQFGYGRVMVNLYTKNPGTKKTFFTRVTN